MIGPADKVVLALRDQKWGNPCWPRVCPCPDGCKVESRWRSWKHHDLVIRVAGGLCASEPPTEAIFTLHGITHPADESKYELK